LPRHRGVGIASGSESAFFRRVAPPEAQRHKVAVIAEGERTPPYTAPADFARPDVVQKERGILAAARETLAKLEARRRDLSPNPSPAGRGEPRRG
jgi:hypothetical protein